MNNDENDIKQSTVEMDRKINWIRFGIIFLSFWSLSLCVPGIACVDTDFVVLETSKYAFSPVGMNKAKRMNYCDEKLTKWRNDVVAINDSVDDGDQFTQIKLLAVWLCRCRCQISIGPNRKWEILSILFSLRKH